MKVDMTVADIEYVLKGLDDFQALEIGEVLLPECTPEEVISLARGTGTLLYIGPGKVEVVPCLY